MRDLTEEGEDMKVTRVDARRVARPLCLALALLLTVALVASCGGAGDAKQSKSDSAKLPPGADQAQQSSSPSSAPSGTSEAQGAAPATTEAKTPSASADLAGGRFTVVGATRPDTNKSVISSGGREVKGDYLEIEFTIQDVATDHLVDLSEYSFRLEGPGIAASTYTNYYGETGTYGKYVNENEISATLLDYSSLQGVTYKVKVGELVEKIFVFFDLNPENTGRNPNVTRDNTSLLIHKDSGTDYGTEVKVPLAGYPD